MRNFTISVAFYRKFATFSDFKKTRDFFGKKTEFGTFWEILQLQSQSTANLKQLDEWKFDSQTHEQPTLACLCELDWQTSGKKTDLFEGKILLSYSQQNGAKKTRWAVALPYFLSKWRIENWSNTQINIFT